MAARNRGARIGRGSVQAEGAVSESPGRPQAMHDSSLDQQIARHSNKELSLAHVYESHCSQQRSRQSRSNAVQTDRTHESKGQRRVALPVPIRPARASIAGVHRHEPLRRHGVVGGIPRLAAPASGRDVAEEHIGKSRPTLVTGIPQVHHSVAVAPVDNSSVSVASGRRKYL